ncbi:endonuclease/exonuclease/phosphatase family protein [Pontibacter russatus]|uniref:endonuclease/exonuclease/phosphatase family protein n=1 Tax=Pontibacter russatus TaxID=2694929 RepID=UPI001379F9D8|nr:endonuclease/exonuclease/phosphatase family protein [Pontibacter russatus]
MTYNIHHANPPSKAEAGDIDIDAIAAVIRKENPDLVALQEVDVNTQRSGKVNQAKAIAEKLGMEAFFGRAIDHQGGYYGVAILSKYPLTETKVTPLPEDAAPASEDRVLASAKVRLPGGMVIRFGSTHLDVVNPENREQQVRAINGIAAEDAVPFIVAGDFNAVPGSGAILELDKTFTRTCTADCAPTIPVDKPDRTIDFIAFSKGSPFEVVSQKVIPERYASDHLPVVATLRY